MNQRANGERGTQGRPKTSDVLSKSTALATAQSAELSSPGDFGEEHKRIVRDFFCAGASPAEFEVLWAGARARRLDPVRKQIHFVSRWDDAKKSNVWSSQVSIDGFRAIAQATGDYDGQDEPENEVDAQGGILVSRVRVYRKGISRAFVGVARWPEFAQFKGQNPTFMWAKMPFHMLDKCAEALALRKAFPEELAGLYEPAEMGNDLPPGDSWAAGKPSPERRTVDATIEEPASEPKREPGAEG